MDPIQSLHRSKIIKVVPPLPQKKGRFFFFLGGGGVQNLYVTYSRNFKHVKKEKLFFLTLLDLINTVTKIFQKFLSKFFNFLI